MPSTAATASPAPTPRARHLRTRAGLVRTLLAALASLAAAPAFGATTIDGGVFTADSDDDFGAVPEVATPIDIVFSNAGRLHATGSFTLDSRRGVSLYAGGGIIETDASVTLTYDGIFSSHGGLTKAGAGTLVLGGVNTQINATALQSGLTIVTSTGQLGASATQLSIASGASLSLQNAAQTVAGLSGGGTLSLSTGHVFTATDSGGGGFAGTLSGAGSFVYAGASSYTFSGDSTGYSGAIQLTHARSRLIVANPLALGDTSAGTTVSAGALQLADVALDDESLVISGTGADAGNAGALTASGVSSASGPVTLVGPAAIGARSGATLTLTGAIGESTPGTGFSKTGSGTLVLAGANTFDGALTISSGILKLGSAGAESAGPLGTTAAGTTVAGSATLDLNGHTLAAAEPLTLAGYGLGSDRNALNNSSATAAAYAGPVTLAGDATIGGSGDITLLAGITGEHSLDKFDAGTLTLAAASTRATAAGATSLYGGTLKLAHAASLNTLATAPLHLVGGTLHLAPATDAATTFTGASAGVGIDSLIVSDRATPGAGLTHTLGRLELAPTPITLTIAPGENVTGGVAGVAFGATTLTAAGTTFRSESGASLTLGALGGNFGFTKTGDGRLVLGAQAAATRTSASATLEAGSLRLAHASALGRAGSTGTLVLAGGELQLASNAAATFNSTATTVSGDVALVSDRATTSGVGRTHTLGTLAIGAHTLALSAGALVTSGTAGVAFGATTLAGDATFAPAAGTSVSLGSVSETGGPRALAKTGAGTLTLSGANTFTGPTHVAAGTLALGSGATLDSSRLVLSPGATLDASALASGFTLSAGQTLAGSGAIVAGLALGAGSFTELQIGGVSPALFHVSGALQAGGTLTVSFSGGYTPTGPATFDLFNFTSFGGCFAQVNLPAVAGHTWNTSQLSFDGTISLVASAIPEPASLAVLAGALACGVSVFRRRQRRA